MVFGAAPQQVGSLVAAHAPEGIAVGAAGRVPGHRAIVAVTAVGVSGDDSVALIEGFTQQVRASSIHLHDDPGGLMPGYVGQAVGGHATVPAVHVRAAERRRVHPHQQAGWLQLRGLHTPNLGGLVEARNNCGAALGHRYSFLTLLHCPTLPMTP